MTASVATALRLGWSVAEVRGRNWPHGPRPTSTPLPPVPGDVLPLRSQRDSSASRQESARSLAALVREMDLPAADDFEDELLAALPPFDGDGDAALVDHGEEIAGVGWQRTARFFLEWDARFQDELTRRGEPFANAYLLGRGVAECYWGLGPEREWSAGGEPTAVSLKFLFGVDRCRELTRMLGRLGSEGIHPISAAAISGSLEAWGAVAADDTWSADPMVRVLLYEQLRRWYQLLILGQDPTTLIRPDASLASLRYVTRTARAFMPQLVMALLALLLTVGALVFGEAKDAGQSALTSLVATGGVGAFIAAGLLARGQSAAQRLVARMRQDAYTDLVAVSVTVVPTYPAGSRGSALRRGRSLVEKAVRRRRLTPPTPAPST